MSVCWAVLQTAQQTAHIIAQPLCTLTPMGHPYLNLRVTEWVFPDVLAVRSVAMTPGDLVAVCGRGSLSMQHHGVSQDDLQRGLGEHINHWLSHSGGWGGSGHSGAMSYIHLYYTSVGLED